jgi:hypothetical protein
MPFAPQEKAEDSEGEQTAPHDQGIIDFGAAPEPCAFMNGHEQAGGLFRNAKQ